MVAYTVHNSRKKAISLSGIKVVSNVLLPGAKIDLNPGLLDKLGANELPSWFGYSSDYEYQTHTYGFPVSNLASGSTTSDAVVVWYPTSRAASRTSFGYNDGTAESSPSYQVIFPEASRSIDPEAASRYATTHVYAVGASEGGQSIAKPNMAIVPIMGTDLNLKSGKAYHMNCELYEQPNIQLGYMSRRPLSYAAAGSKQQTQSLVSSSSLRPRSRSMRMSVSSHSISSAAIWIALIPHSLVRRLPSRSMGRTTISLTTTRWR